MKVKVEKSPSQEYDLRKGSEGAAGWDIPVNDIVSLYPGQKEKICTGIAIQPEKGFYAELVPRSSAGDLEYELANTIGIIDNDFNGFIQVYVKNTGTAHFVAHPGDYLFQLIFKKEVEVEFEAVTSLKETKRGAGKFGSTTKGKTQ